MNNISVSRLFIFFSISFLLFSNSCKGPKREPLKPLSNITTQILILNEGTFGYGNAEISACNLDSSTIENNIFKRKNNSDLGDVLQSAQLFDNKYFFCLNSSGKIVITDTNFSYLGAVNNLKSPRFIYFVSQNKAYVSDLFQNKITIINPALKTTIGFISCKGWTENWLKDQKTNNVWVSNRFSNYIYKIDTNTDLITDSIKTDYGPSELVLDRNNHLWVSCSGSNDNNILSSILKIDMETKTILKKYNSGTNYWDSRLCLNGSKDTLFWIDNNVKKMPIDAIDYPKENLIMANGRIFYGLGINPNNSDVYVSDAIDYVQAGDIYKYSKSGKELSKFKAGIIPNTFIFK